MGLRLTHKNALWVAVGKFWVVWVRRGLVRGKKYPQSVRRTPPYTTSPHFPHTSPTRKNEGKRLSRCAPKRYMHPPPHFPNILYILLPLFFLSSSSLFFSPKKKGDVGEVGEVRI